MLAALPNELQLLVCCFLEPAPLFALRQTCKSLLHTVNSSIFVYAHIFQQLAPYMPLSLLTSLLTQQHYSEICLLNYPQFNEQLLNFVMAPQHALTVLHVHLNMIDTSKIFACFLQVNTTFWKQLRHLGLTMYVDTNFCEIYNAVLQHCTQLKRLYLNLTCKKIGTKSGALLPVSQARLDFAKQDNAIAQVSQLFSTQLEEIEWIFAGHNSWESDLLELVNTRETLKRLSLPKMNEFLTYCPRVVFTKLLSLDFVVQGTNVDQLNIIGQCMPKLEHITLRPYGVSQDTDLSFLYTLSKLRELQLICSYACSFTLPKLFKHCKNMERIKLERCDSFDAFDQLNEFVKALQRIEVRYGKVSEKMISGISKCTRLQFVSFYYSDIEHKIIQQNMPWLVKHVYAFGMALPGYFVRNVFNPQLQKVEFVDCSMNDTDNRTKFPIYDLPNLHTARLSRNFPGAVFNALTNLYSLKVLDISENVLMSSDYDIAALIKQAPNLASLQACDTQFGAFCQAVIPQHIKRLELSNAIRTPSLNLIKPMPQLEHLIIGGAGDLKQEQESELARLLSAMLMLKVLILEASICLDWNKIVPDIATCKQLQRLSITGNKNKKCVNISLESLAILLQLSSLQYIMLDIPVTNFALWKKTHSSNKPQIIVPHQIQKSEPQKSCSFQ